MLWAVFGSERAGILKGVGESWRMFRKLEIGLEIRV